MRRHPCSSALLLRLGLLLKSQKAIYPTVTVASVRVAARRCYLWLLLLLFLVPFWALVAVSD